MSSYSPASQGATTANRLVLAGVGNTRVTEPVDLFTTTNATPHQFWSRALIPGKHTRVVVEVAAHDNTTGNLVEWQVRSIFGQTSGGTSKRGGAANGANDSAVNDFGGQNGKITFGDPAGTGIITASAVGKAGTTIGWTITVTYQEGI